MNCFKNIFITLCHMYYIDVIFLSLFNIIVLYKVIMEKRACNYQGCKTLTEVDESKDVIALGAYMVKWCKPCENKHKLFQKEITKLMKKYNKKQIKDKRGNIYIFKSPYELSNYLYRHKPATLKKIDEKVKLKQVLQ